jgi:hypothetical protein
MKQAEFTSNTIIAFVKANHKSAEVQEIAPGVVSIEVNCRTYTHIVGKGDAADMPTFKQWFNRYCMFGL